MIRTILLAALISSPALAQTTNCVTTGNQSRCQTTPTRPSKMDNVNAGAQLVGSLEAQGRATQDAIARDFERARARQAQERAIVTAASEQSLRYQVGSLILQGKCDEATALALRSGNLVVAGEVKPLCTKAPTGQ